MDIITWNKNCVIDKAWHGSAIVNFAWITQSSEGELIECLQGEADCYSKPWWRLVHSYGQGMHMPGFVLHISVRVCPIPSESVLLTLAKRMPTFATPASILCIYTLFTPALFSGGSKEKFKPSALCMKKYCARNSVHENIMPWYHCFLVNFRKSLGQAFGSFSGLSSPTWPKSQKSRIVMFPAIEMLESTRAFKLAVPPPNTRSGYWARNVVR